MRDFFNRKKYSFPKLTNIKLAVEIWNNAGLDDADEELDKIANINCMRRKVDEDLVNSIYSIIIGKMHEYLRKNEYHFQRFDWLDDVWKPFSWYHNKGKKTKFCHTESCDAWIKKWFEDHKYRNPMPKYIEFYLSN